MHVVVVEVRTAEVGRAAVLDAVGGGAGGEQVAALLAQRWPALTLVDADKSFDSSDKKRGITTQILDREFIFYCL